MRKEQGEDQYKKQLTRFEEYLRNRELSQNTILNYLISMKQFFQMFSEVSKENGIKFKGHLQSRKAKPSTINMRINAFNTYCKMLGEGQNRVKTIPVHQETTVNNVISRKDYQRLLEELRKDGNHRWYFTVKILAMTGARVSEAVRITKEDFDVGCAEMWTKGKIRRIYIPLKFRLEAAAFYAELDGKELLIRNKRGGAISTRGVAYMLQSFAKRYQIDKRVMHPHAFRHLFAMEFLKETNNLALLSDLMGHSNVTTTAIYTRMTREQQEHIINSTIDW